MALLLLTVGQFFWWLLFQKFVCLGFKFRRFQKRISLNCLDNFTTRRTTLGFVQVWLDVAAINSSAYPSFGSGGTSNIQH
jgi:hypothetical protein